MKKLIKWVCYIFIALVIIGYAAVKSKKPSESLNSQTQTAKPLTDVLKLTANKLSKQYEENETATDKQVKGKLISVDGVVQSVDKDFTDTLIVYLRTDNQFMPARMALENTNKATAASIKKGQPVTIICKKMTKMVGSPYGQNCTLN